MLQIDLINVGYGDSVLVREDGGFAMLIDCGAPDIGTGERALYRCTAADYLESEQVKRLDVLLLTHLHIDHIGTLPRIAERVAVNAFWTGYLPDRALWNAVPETLAPLARGMGEYLASLTLLERQGCAMRELSAKLTVRLTDALTARVDFAHEYLLARQHRVLDRALSGSPDLRELTLHRRYVNVVCPILTLSYHGKRIVLPGDVYGHFLHDYAESPGPESGLPVALLKAPHHGCPFSVTDRLLGALRPETIAVSVASDREDDRPNEAAVACMQRFAASVRFTDAVTIGGIAEPPHRALRIAIP